MGGVVSGLRGRHWKLGLEFSSQINGTRPTNIARVLEVCGDFVVSILLGLGWQVARS